jgi:hypothetical protein
MAKQIQIRRDTAANWTAANPVLAQGEIGIELDGLGTSTVLQKIGDGVTAWDSLPYQESGGGVETISGDGVDNTDPENPVLSFPNPSDIGLGNVDNTSDADKPISNATQTALDDKASDADLTTLGSEVSINTQNIGLIDTRVTTNEGDISTLQTEVANKADQTDLTTLDGRVTTNEGDIQTLQNNQVNPNNFVNKVTSTTQDMTGRLTVQTPLDTNTSDAANVQYVNNKLGGYIEEATVASSTEKGGLFFDYDSVTNTLILKAQ